jgi:hypothetical protein
MQDGHAGQGDRMFWCNKITHFRTHTYFVKFDKRLTLAVKEVAKIWVSLGIFFNCPFFKIAQMAKIRPNLGSML